MLQESGFWIPFWGVEWLPVEPTMRLEDWNFPSTPYPSLQPPGMGEGMEFESMVHGQWCSQSYLCDEASRKIQEDRVWRASGLVTTGSPGDSAGLRKAKEALCLSPYCAPGLPPSLQAGSSWIMLFYNKLIICKVKHFFAFYEPLWQINWAQWGIFGIPNLWPLSQKCRWQSGLRNWHLNWETRGTVL